MRFVQYLPVFVLFSAIAFAADAPVVGAGTQPPPCIAKGVAFESGEVTFDSDLSLNVSLYVIRSQSDQVVYFNPAQKEADPGASAGWGLVIQPGLASGLVTNHAMRFQCTVIENNQNKLVSCQDKISACGVPAAVLPSGNGDQYWAVSNVPDASLWQKLEDAGFDWDVQAKEPMN